MFAYHGGFYAAAASTPRPPAGAPALRIAPGGSGDGSSWANAAAIGSLNSLIAKARETGAEIWIRADAGSYILLGNQIALSQGGASAAKPVIIKGVDVNGTPMKALFIGTRSVPWSVGATYGNYGFWLNAGCNHLDISFLSFKGFGPGCIRVRQTIANIYVHDCDALHCARFFEQDVSTISINGFRIERCDGDYIAKTFIRVRGYSNNGYVFKCNADGRNIDGDRISCMFILYDYANNILFEKCIGRNVYNDFGPGAYWNGDIFSSERGNSACTYIDCEAYDATDRGFDLKGTGVYMLRCHVERCKRPFAIWQDALLEKCSSVDFIKRGGTGSTSHLTAMHNTARLLVKGAGPKGFTQTASNGSPITVINHAFFFADAEAMAAIVKPANVPMYNLEGYGLDGYSDYAYGVWDHNDFTPPVITSSLDLETPENKNPTWFLLEASKPVTFNYRGQNANKIAKQGRVMMLGAQDYEAEGGAAGDGTNVLKFDVQAVDANGNTSPWMPVRITINDVPDNPFPPEELRNYGTAGYWWDNSDIGSYWQDIERTIPCELGTYVARLDDKSGFGNHLTQPNPDLQGRLIIAPNGTYGIELNGGVRYNIGAPGALRFPQFTAFCTAIRSRDDENTNSYVLYHGRRNTAADNGSNAVFRIGFNGGQSVIYRTTSTNQTSGGSGGARNAVHVLSYRTSDGVVRSDGVQVIDGADVAANGYALTNEQGLVGCTYDGTNYANYLFGTFFGGVCINAAVDNDTRFRIERQLAQFAGRNLIA